MIIVRRRACRPARVRLSPGRSGQRPWPGCGCQAVVGGPPGQRHGVTDSDVESLMRQAGRRPTRHSLRRRDRQTAPAPAAGHPCRCQCHCIIIITEWPPAPAARGRNQARARPSAKWGVRIYYQYASMNPAIFCILILGCAMCILFCILMHIYTK
jgi:hypothetical protein